MTTCVRKFIRTQIQTSTATATQTQTQTQTLKWQWQWQEAEIRLRIRTTAAFSLWPQTLVDNPFLRSWARWRGGAFELGACQTIRRRNIYRQAAATRDPQLPKKVSPHAPHPPPASRVQWDVAHFCVIEAI